METAGPPLKRDAGWLRFVKRQGGVDRGPADSVSVAPFSVRVRKKKYDEIAPLQEISFYCNNKNVGDVIVVVKIVCMVGGTGQCRGSR